MDKRSQILTRELKTLHINKQIFWQNGGLISHSIIPKNKILFHISKYDCISILTIPQQMKRQMQQIAKNQKQLDIDQQLILTLYMMHLKIVINDMNHKGYQQNHNIKIQIQQKQKQSQILEKNHYSSKGLTFYRWLQSQTMGFISFNSQYLNILGDIDLIIERAAYKNHILTVSTILYKYYAKLQYFYEISFEQFHKTFLWAMQFKNTRSFGWTKHTTLLPWFDYMNYHHNVNVQFINIEKIPQNNDYILQQQEKQDKQDSDDQRSENDSLQSMENYSEGDTIYGIVSKKQIQPNQQLLFNYGSHTNRYYLKWYGFIIPNNPNNNLIMYIDIYDKKSQEIVYDKLHRNYQRIKLRKNKLSYTLLKQLRKQYFVKNYKNKLWNLPLKIDQEIFILNKFIERMNKYPVKQPIQQWKSHKDERYWLYIYGRQNRELYENQIDIFETIIKYLNQTINQQKLKQSIINIKEYLNYCKDFYDFLKQ